MTDDVISQAPTEVITPEVEVQEATPSTEGSTPAEPQPEKTVPTLEDYRQIAREEAMRVAQSQVAKSENRTNQRIAERFAALEQNKGVLKLTDEQVTAAQQQIINEETMNQFKPKAEGQASPQADVNADDVIQQNVDFVYAQIGETFAEAGVEVNQNDPEFKGIDAALRDPKGSLAKTLRAANKAAEEKAARLKAHKEGAAARISGGGGSATSSTYDPNKPASFYLEQAQKANK